MEEMNVTLTTQEITYYKEIIDRGDKLERLLNNADFKELITEGYCQNLADSLVSCLSKASPTMKDIMNSKLLGISYFKEYIDLIGSEKVRAKEALAGGDE